MITSHPQLSRYPAGSLRELWTVSFPLILSILSVNLMLFFDRILLARYDTGAMNAAVVSGYVFAVFQFAAIGIASISEVFVGQYNGANKPQKMGEAVWQMIWFSLMTSFIFIPVGLFLGPSLIVNSDAIKEGIPFFETLMLFGPTFPLAAALGAFFIGKGQGKLVMISTVSSNVVNVLLDFTLIYGVANVVPALGAKGAAIATGVAQSLQCIMLFGFFLNRQFQEKYGTRNWHLRPILFKEMLGIGLPNSLCFMIDGIAWGVAAHLLSSVSVNHITVFSIGDSFYVLFVVGFWGLRQGMIAVASNYIGAGKEALLSNAFRSGIKSIILIMLVLTIPLIVFPGVFANIFLGHETDLNADAELRNYVVAAMRWVWVYFLFDAIAWLISGILTAAGDTRFIMILNSVATWGFVVIPLYIYVVCFGGPPVVSWLICAGYAFLNALCCYARYKSKRWKREQPLHALNS